MTSPSSPFVSTSLVGIFIIPSPSARTILVVLTFAMPLLSRVGILFVRIASRVGIRPRQRHASHGPCPCRDAKHGAPGAGQELQGPHSCHASSEDCLAFPLSLQALASMSADRPHLEKRPHVVQVMHERQIPCLLRWVLPLLSTQSRSPADVPEVPQQAPLGVAVDPLLLCNTNTSHRHRPLASCSCPCHPWHLQRFERQRTN